MKITVTDPIPEVIPEAHTFTVRFVTMSGDADDYKTNEITSFKPGEDDEALESLLNLFEKMLKAFPCGRGGNEDEAYANHVPEFTEWFEDTYTEEKQKYSPIAWNFLKRTGQLTATDWPSDIYTWEAVDLHGEGQLTEYEVIYYDDASQPHKTEVEL